MKEIELKFLDIDVLDIKKKLEAIWAKLDFESEVEWYVFWTDWFSENDASQKYLRVRKINNIVEVCFKWPSTDWEMTVREEIEFIADDYNQALLFLEKLWFTKTRFFKKYREHYIYWNIHFEIESHQHISPYLEIETGNKKDMKDICKKLNLDLSQWKKGTIVEILPEKFK